MSVFQELTQKNQEKRRVMRSQMKMQEYNDNTDESMESVTFSLLFPQIFNSCPLSDPTEKTTIDRELLILMKRCCILCQNTYWHPDKRKLPSEVGPIVFDQKSYFPGQVPFFITNSDELNEIYIAIRGTYCYADFLTDLMALAVNTDQGQMHIGVYIAAQICFSQLQNFVLNLSASYNNRPILVTGHSLGGAVADAVCHLIRKAAPHIPCRSIVFAPAASSSRSCYQKSLETTITFIQLGDPVPFLCLENIMKVLRSTMSPGTAIGLKNLCAKIVRNQRQRMSEIRRMPQDFNPFINQSPPLIPEEQETADGMGQIPMYPPGKYYLIIQNESGEVELHSINDPDYFGHFCKDLSEFKHAMAGYMRTVHKYYDQNIGT